MIELSEDSKCFWEFTCIDSGTVFGTTFKKRGVVMGYHGRRDTTCAFWPVRTLSKWHKLTSTEPCTYIQPYNREPKCPQNGTSKSILLIGASLSEPHTSMTALRTCLYMYVCLFAAIYRKF